MESDKPILIQFHFHKRKTGLTSSIENVLPYLEQDFELYIFGSLLSGQKIGWGRVFRLLKANRKVIIHAHRNNEIIRALLLRMLGFDFKLVATRHAESPPSKLTLGLLRKADQVISLTFNMQQSLPLSSSVIGHGVQTDFFVPDPRAKIQNVSQQNIICVAGRVRERKGHQVVLDALIPILGNYPNWALVVVGKVDDQNFVERLKTEVLQKELTIQVYFHPETKEIKNYYQASKIVVVPSYSEGFSLVCLEAMSCGVTVVATRGVGVHDDVIDDQKTGYLFPPGDSDGLQKILLGLISRELKCTSEAGRNKIVNEWSAQKEANQLKLLYLQ
ncbi:glycosyltransferase family 4 protein [Belliella pelovolcani]|uniref:Mannosyltransferase n=1 Tax=Belliella pelovolcani TaxID=529505 RepID=A0A1N7NK52_9BACT|nr:glycosyltransferase family 4 protein [Belliella pelovolcani]SIS98559.1 mannosyltransferase [Belliella pelovolcani]